jgi:hypothetical protein
MTETLDELYWRTNGDGIRPADRRPDFLIDEADLPETARRLAELIAQHTIFLSNGYMPIRVVVDKNNFPRAIEVNAESVCDCAHELCSPFKIKKKDGELVNQRVSITKEQALRYLKGLEGRWGLKPFNGITTSPILRGDGSIRLANGYDPETGLWCHNVPGLFLPDRPTDEEARASMHRLRSFFRTFPFADAPRRTEGDNQVVDVRQKPGLDESIFLAALLTAVTRQSLEFAPAVLVDAPNASGAGSGKGYTVQAIMIIATGAKPAAFTSGHNIEEFEKRLTAALIQAHPGIFLDNFNAKELKSDTLASVLTSNPAMVRPLGVTGTLPLHVRTFIGITGNAVQISEDMARRVINVHLDAQMEDPEQRKFEPGFLDRVLAARSWLLTDALTIWRWGRQQTTLKPGKPIGNFEVWAQWVRDPLLALDCRDPVDRIRENKEADPVRLAIVEFYNLWWELHLGQTVKATDISPEIIRHIDDKATIKSDGGLQYSRQKITSFLDRQVGARIGGYVLSKFPLDRTASRPKMAYKLERTNVIDLRTDQEGAADV